MAELEERHDVDLGVNYRYEKAAAEFISYIAKTYCKEFERAMASVNFSVSRLMEAQTMQMLKMKCFWHFTLIIARAMEGFVFETNCWQFSSQSQLPERAFISVANKA